MPSLIGSSLDYATNWATSNGVSLSKIEVYEGDEHFNYLYGDGIVADQSIHVNSVIGIGTNLTIYVNKRPTSTGNTDNNNQSNSENNNSEEKPTRNENDTVIENEE